MIYACHPQFISSILKLFHSSSKFWGLFQCVRHHYRYKDSHWKHETVDRLLEDATLTEAWIAPPAPQAAGQFVWQWLVPPQPKQYAAGVSGWPADAAPFNTPEDNQSPVRWFLVSSFYKSRHWRVWGSPEKALVGAGTWLASEEQWLFASGAVEASLETVVIPAVCPHPSTSNRSSNNTGTPPEPITIYGFILLAMIAAIWVCNLYRASLQMKGPQTAGKVEPWVKRQLLGLWNNGWPSTPLRPAGEPAADTGLQWGSGPFSNAPLDVFIHSFLSSTSGHGTGAGQPSIPGDSTSASASASGPASRAGFPARDTASTLSFRLGYRPPPHSWLLIFICLKLKKYTHKTPS